MLLKENLFLQQNLDKKKKIAVFTSTRAEYGLLLPLLRKINKHPRFSLRLLVGGSHLVDNYGKTIDFIIKDNLKITACFPFLSEDTKEAGKHDELSLLSKQAGDYFLKEKPDMLILLGDRYELLSIASVALVMNVPVGHISGGDITEGAIDNQVRHALTKMAHLHFPATETAKNNLLKMGEEPWRICLSGEPGLDEIHHMDFIQKKDLFEGLGIPLDEKLVIATFHPETIDNKITPAFVRTLLKSLAKDFHVLVTASNFDTGGPEINEMLINLSMHSNKITYRESLGQKRYYSVLKYAKAMIGNSSSGILEAQSFNLPVINIGKRQQGRLANRNVINAAPIINEIFKTLKKALSKKFIDTFANQPNIYGDGHAADRILHFLSSAIDNSGLLMKKSV